MSLHWKLIDEPLTAPIVARSWNDLWDRSTSRSPVARAEQIALWHSTFAADQPLRLVVVLSNDDGGSQEQTTAADLRRSGSDNRGEVNTRPWLAAMPIVRQRWRRMLPVGSLPGNEWSPAGELLVDERALAQPEIADTLAAGLGQLSLPLFRLHGVATAAPAWQLLRAALQRQGWTADVRPIHDVPLLERFADWSACRESWSKEHRHNVERLRRRIDENGGATLVRYRLHEYAEDAARELLLRALAVERRSWKGEEQTAVTCDMARTDFFVEQARLLARTEAAELVCLERDGAILAFAYGWRHRGVVQVAKIGYDPEFARFGPGQLLFHDWLRELHADPNWVALDFLGPATPALRRWTDHCYSVERLLLAPSRWLSRTLLRTLRPALATSLRSR